jgi:short-subunit dehydrogenase
MEKANKIILITGASSGIGAKTAEFAAKEFGTVILLARSEEKLRSIAEKINNEGNKAYYFPVDLSDPIQIKQTAEQIKKEIGIPDVIINNAGVGRWLTIEETGDDELKAMMDLPFSAAFNLTKAFISEMKERSSGHIINLTSDASFLPKGNAIGYTSARYALRGFSESLRAYLAGTGIDVSLAVFGKVNSSYWENNPGSEERVPPPGPFMKILSTDDVAGYLIKMIKNKKRILIKPGIFKTLFWAFRKWPDQISKKMNESLKK